MRLLVVALIAIAGVMMAMDPDAGPRVSFEAPPQGRADITMTVINDYALTGFSSPRGLDYADTFGELVMTDFGQDILVSMNPDNGSVTGSLACPSQIPNVLGVACIEAAPGNWDFYINDWQDVMDVWKIQGAGSWTMAFANPVPQEPRGMDFDDDGMLWSIDAATRIVYRFNTSGGSVSSWALADLPSSFSCGISTFPLDGNLGIVIGGYSYGNFYFFEFDGSSVEFIGSAAEPQTSAASYGIAYSYDRDSFFWLYRVGTSEYHITEFDLTIETALARETWGGIKASF